MKKTATKRKVAYRRKDTKWRAEMNDSMIAFFNEKPFEEIEIVTTGKNDYKKVEKKRMPNLMPTFQMFADMICVNGDTIVEWAKEENTDKYPGFREAYLRAKELQKWFLIQNGLQGLYNATFAIFTAKNVTDMRDQTDVNQNISGSITTKTALEDLGEDTPYKKFLKEQLKKNVAKNTEGS